MDVTCGASESCCSRSLQAMLLLTHLMRDAQQGFKKPTSTPNSQFHAVELDARKTRIQKVRSLNVHRLTGNMNSLS
eukprot:4025057-Amphidinium_carterae.1